MKSKKSKAYIQGYKDFHRGKRGHRDNPYKYGSRAHYDWETANIECANLLFDKIIKKHSKK